MWKTFFAFDLRFHLRQPLLWASALPLVFMAFMSASSDKVRIGGAIGYAHLNAPVVIANQLAVLSIIALFLVVVFIAGAILRDTESGMADMLFATPMRKLDYLLGRYLAGFTTCLLVFALVVAAMMVGSGTSSVDPTRLGEFSWYSYVWSFMVFVAPNLLFISALLVLLAATTRSMTMVYVGVLAFIAFWSIAGFLGGRAESTSLAVLLDPFGVRVLSQATRYYTSADINSRLPELSGALLMNRVLWTGIAIAMFCATLVLFKPQRAGTGRNWLKRRAPETGASKAASVPLRRITPQFTRATAWMQLGRLMRTDTFGILRSLPFLVMLLLALANFFANYTIGGVRFDSTPYPLTRLMLEELAGGLNDMLALVLLFYSGELVWKDRQARIDGLADALPMPNWVPLLSKAGTLIVIVFTFLLAGVAAAIGIQLTVGGAEIELGLYAQGTLIASAWFILIGLAMLALQVIAGNKYVGYALSIALLVSGVVLRGMQVEDNLAIFASLPTLRYSDMNGYGHYLEGWSWFALYWSLFVAALLFAAQGFWTRGTAQVWRQRVAGAVRKLRGPAGAACAGCLCAFAAAGNWIYYNTHVLNEYQSITQLQAFSADYEKTYRKDINLPVPSLTGVKADVDLFPAEGALRIHGSYVLQNKTDAVLTVLRIQKDVRAETRFYGLPEGRLVRNDRRFGVQDWQLDKPLAPGGKLTLAFTVDVRRRGFTNSGAPEAVNANGTLLAFEQFFPKFGYNQSLEITEAGPRKALGLGDAHPMPKREDTLAQSKNYWKLFGIEADFIDFETTVSTSADQVALAPGTLLKSWEKSGRRYFHYKMDRPILPFFGYQSARWEVRRAEWKGVPIEVYYDRKHAWNVDRMIDGTKGALDYYTENFGPYPYQQVRIVETPLYQSYARAFPTLTPFSESLGFINDLRDPNAADHVYYVTAHELAHSWWGDQAIAANVQGGGLITESVAEYSALMAFEKRFGPEKTRSILRFDLDTYLRGRAADGVAEQPLDRNESQIFLQYRKASLVFYRLREEIGEAAINRALKRLLDEKRYQTRPYLTSVDLLHYLRAETPAAQQKLVTDMFERIVFYDNRVLAAKARALTDGRWELAVTVKLAKTEADATGKESVRDYDEAVDIAVFDGKRQLHSVQKSLPSGESQVRIVVDAKPTEVAIDPRQLLIDRVQTDNRRTVDF
jgi:ABC-type transport system involved in multi-copper enzyme maturation permease subunit